LTSLSPLCLFRAVRRRRHLLLLGSFRYQFLAVIPSWEPEDMMAGRNIRGVIIHA
jgi:hypothetical protein